jgi:hypothetical protein
MSFTPKQLKAIELLAQGELSGEAITVELKMSRSNLCRWKKDPDFMQAIVERSRQLLKETLPQIYKSLTNNSKKGSHNHIKVYLDHLEKLEEAKANTGTITFIWKRATTPDEES